MKHNILSYRFCKWSSKATQQVGIYTMTYKT
jgi:hypothetical protein